MEKLHELAAKLLPHVVTKVPELLQSIADTLYMVSFSGVIAFAVGLVFGTVLVTTKKGGILQNAVVFNVLDKILHLFRSIPFIILLAGLIPLTRLVAGTAIGTKGAILPLIFGTVPFFSRQVESVLSDVSPNLVETAQAMGCSPAGIIFRVYLRESIAGLVRVTVITAVSLIGLSAMAGAVGGGGLGDFAIRYGHQRNQVDVTYVTVLILLVIVMALQKLGNVLIKKAEHK